MKNKVLIFLLVILQIATVSAQKIELTVSVTGFDNDKGMAYIALYNNEEDFLKKPFIGKIVKISSKKTQVIFSDLNPGTYAVSLFHDENGNGKLDTNFMGIPKEDYGCSNNAKGFMSAPKYKEAKLVLNQNKAIQIKI